MGLHVAPDAHIRSNPWGQIGQSVGEGISSRIQKMFEQKENQRSLDALRPLMLERGIDEETTNEILGSGAPAGFIQKQLELRDRMQLEGNKLAAREQKLQGRDKEQAQDVFNQLVNFSTQPDRLVGNRTPLAPGLSKDSRAARAEFDTLSSSLLGDLIEGMHLRGTISDRKFRLLQSLIPKSNDSRTKMKGKLRALGRELGLDFSSLDQQGSPKQTEAVPNNDEKSSFKVGQSFDELPSPEQAGKNAIIRDPDTGQRWISTGKEWKKVGK